MISECKAAFAIYVCKHYGNLVLGLRKAVGHLHGKLHPQFRKSFMIYLAKTFIQVGRPVGENKHFPHFSFAKKSVELIMFM